MMCASGHKIRTIDCRWREDFQGRGDSWDTQVPTLRGTHISTVRVEEDFGIAPPAELRTECTRNNDSTDARHCNTTYYEKLVNTFPTFRGSRMFTAVRTMWPTHAQFLFKFCWQCIVIYPCNMNQQDALFSINFSNKSLHSVYTQLILVMIDEQQACSKHVEAYYWNKLIINSASCWFILYGFMRICWYCN